MMEVDVELAEIEAYQAFSAKASIASIREVCHQKTDQKVFVVVIPKEGWAHDFVKTQGYIFFLRGCDNDLKVCFLVTHLKMHYGRMF